MKRRAFICLALVLAIAAMVFVACSPDFDDDTLLGEITKLESELKQTVQTPASYTLKKTIGSYDEKGNLRDIYIKWTIEDTYLITVTEGDGEVTVNIPETRSADINYKLRATLVDEDGKAYTEDGKNFTVAVSRVAPKTDVGGGDDEGKLTADILRGALSALESELKKTEQTPASYTLDRTLAVKDDKNNDATVYVKWTVEDTDLVTVTESNGTVTVNIPDTRSADINYKLRATLVDEDGKKYNEDGNNFTVAVSRVAPKTDVGGGDEPTPSDKGTRDNPYTPIEALGVGGMLSDDQFTDDAVYVKGYVVAGSTSNGSTPYKGGQGDWSFHLSDTEDGGPDFYVFFATPTVDITVLQPGDQVTVYGFIEKFNGEIQMYGGGSSDKAKPTIVEYVEGDGDHGGGSVTPPTPGGDLTGEGTLDNPYTVADALTIIGSLAQGGYSDSAVYVQGTITGEITKGDDDELKFVIMDNGSGKGLTIWYAKPAECQPGDTVVVYGYLWNFYNNTTQSYTAEMADYKNVELAIVKVNGQDPSGGGEVTPPTPGGDTSEWEEYIDTYELVEIDDTSDALTLEVKADSIVITHGSVSTIDAAYIEFVADEPEDGIDLLCFLWDDTRWYFFIYPDDKVQLTDENGEFCYCYESDANFEGNPSDDWSKYVDKSYKLFAADWDTEEIFEDEFITVKVNRDSIDITKDGTTDKISSLEFYTDAVYYGYVSDDFVFEWDGEEYILSFYDDGEVYLSGDIHLYIGSESGTGEDPTPGGDLTGEGTLDNPYTVADALTIIGSLAQGEYSDSAVYVQGTITGEITKGDDDELKFVIMDNGSGKGLTIWYAKPAECQPGDTVVVYGYLWNFYNNTTQSYTAEMADYKNVELAIVKVNGQDPSGGGDHGGGDTGNTVTIDFTAQGYTNAQVMDASQTINGLNIAFAKGSNSSTAATFYENKNGNHLRLYADNTMTISGATMTKIVFVFAKYDETNPITVNTGTFDTNTWTGSATSVSFHVGENDEGWHGHRRIVSITVTLASGQGGTTPGGTTPGGGSGSDTVEWQKYIGVYNLVGVDLETLEYTTDTVKIEITKNSIIITYNNGTPTTITDFEFSAGDVDSEDYVYDGFYFEWSGADCCFAVYVDDGYTDFGDLDGEQFYYVVSEDYGDDDPGTSSDDWSQYVGKTYTLANIEDKSDTVTVKVTANSIVITHNGNSTTVTEFDFYIDAIYMGDHYDDFEFEWNGVETFFSVYEDGYVELGARDDSFYYYAESGTGEDPTPGGGGEVTGNTVTIDFTAQGYSDQSVATDITEHGITVSFAAGTNQSNAPKWFDNGSSVRVYGGNTITISGATIVKVVIHFASKEYDNNAITTNVGNFSNDTWTGSTDTLIFTVGGNSGNRRIVSMDITVNGEIGGGSTTPGGGGTTPTPGGGTEPGGDQETPTGTITYDFVTAYGTYGPSWSNSYTNRTLTSSDLGIKSTVEFVFSNAGQGTTISDRPVLASKSGAEQYLTVNGGGAKITSVTFNLQEWVTEGGGAPKKFYKLRIEYTTDGSIWTEVSGVGFEDSNGKQITDYLTLSSGTLPSGVVSVRLVYAGAMSNSSDKSNKQFGLSSIILTLA